MFLSACNKRIVFLFFLPAPPLDPLPPGWSFINYMQMSSLEFDNLRRETTVRVQIEGRGEGFSKWGAKNII